MSRIKRVAEGSLTKILIFSSLRLYKFQEHVTLPLYVKTFMTMHRKFFKAGIKPIKAKYAPK